MSGSGNNTKYAIIILLLLFGAAALIWFALPKGEEKKAEQPVVKTIDREKAMAETAIEVPDDVPDATVPDATLAPSRIKTRTSRNSWSTCTGKIGASAARAVAVRNQRQVRSCYERQLRSNNMLAGKLQLKARVDSKGSVTGVQLSGSMRDSTVKACVKRVASSWKFPPPSGGKCAVINAPFNLTPKG